MHRWKNERIRCLTGRERQTEDRLWQQLVEVAGVAGGPATEARAKEVEMPSELLVTPSARLRPLLPHQSLLGPPTLSASSCLRTFALAISSNGNALPGETSG